MRVFLSCLAFLFLAASAPAQIVGVTFKDAKHHKKYKKQITTVRGAQMVMGEIKSGITYDRANRNVTWNSGGSAVLFVPDPKKPGAAPYKMKNGELVGSTSKNEVTISGGHIEKIFVLMADETLIGLSNEYNIRNEQIEEFKDERDRHDKTTTPWAVHHVRLVTAMDRLAYWLEQTGFSEAGAKLRKEIVKQDKSIKLEAVRARGQKAIESIREIEVPEALTEISEEFFEGRDKFHAMDSQHLRIYFIDTISKEQVRDALRVGEEVIEGFRAEFVDPYLSDDYKDFIPDDLFQEFLFFPPTNKAKETYSNKFYGVSYHQNREARLAAEGGGTIGGVKPFFKSFWKNQENQDLPGIVCHRLGHTLATLHFGSGTKNLQQDWLAEGVGYYISFEHLGRNNVTCKAFHQDEETYRKREIKKVEGDKTVGEGRRDVYNEVALTKGRPIDQLALKLLFEMDDADLAKSWSFFDYVARKEGKAGQLWLRAAGKFAGGKKTFIQKWREAGGAALGVSPGEAFRAIEKRWRAYADNDQDTSGAPRRKK